MTRNNLQLIALPLFLTVLVGSCESTQKAKARPLTGTESSAEQSVRQEHYLSDEPTSENDQRLERGLAKYPRADTNRDGVLTLSEIRGYMAKQRETGKRRNPTGLAADLRRFFEDRQYVSKDGGRLRYDLMKPKDYDHGKKYPLVLWLHGRGGSIRPARVLIEAILRAEYPCFVLAPEALVGETWGKQSPQIQTDVQPLVLEIIETLKNEFSIDTKRLYITGQSMGGFGTYAFITRNPGMFAAAVSVCGRGDPAKAEYIAKIPIWIFHGDKDAVVPVGHSRDMFEALKKAGGDPKYTEYEGIGHNSWDKAYATDELWAWLFAQRKMGK
ncbi:MAG: carboxylesterase family protein [Planctomycetota bacterium]|jgi:predicted peptidase